MSDFCGPLKCSDTILSISSNFFKSSNPLRVVTLIIFDKRTKSQELVKNDRIDQNVNFCETFITFEPIANILIV